MPTVEEWKAAFPQTASISQRAVSRLYEKHGGDAQFFADLLEWKIPQPWLQEVVAVTDQNAIRMFRLDRALDRLERVVAKFAEVVQKMSAESGRGKR